MNTDKNTDANETEFRAKAVERIAEATTGDKKYFRQVSKENLSKWTTEELKYALEYLESVLCYSRENKAGALVDSENGARITAG